MLLHLGIGVVSAGLTIALTSSLKPDQQRQIYAIALIIAAFIYIGFSFRSGEWQWLLIESSGALIFSMMAIVGLKSSLLWLVAGWLVHPIWDVSLHQVHQTTFVPTWYPILCLGYDGVMAFYLLIKLKPLSNLQYLPERE
jgi:uncharacterized membrane protein